MKLRFTAAMKAIIFSLLILGAVTCTKSIKAQEFTQATADAFVGDLVQNPAELEKWVHADELALSRRLGVHYYDVQNKFLISYDVGDDVRKQISIGTLEAKYHIHELDIEYKKLLLTFEGIDPAAALPTYEFYFFNRSLISPVRYHSRNWHRFESDYFIFYISDWSIFNEYSAKKLDAFVEETLDNLEVPQELKAKLKEAKIYYFRCRDADQMRILTGCPGRGMYNLAYDYIISTYNCHYHEVAHLLVNYKLRDVHLLTHPFLQEGIAVALGGRGGRDQPVIMNLGMFLEHSGFVSYKDLLSYESFAQMDASLSYPLSGLYNEFIVREIGIEDYLKLYTQFSGSNSRGEIPSNILPAEEHWNSHLQSCNSAQPIIVDSMMISTCDTIHADMHAQICQSDDLIDFKIQGAVLIGEEQPPEYFQSTIFKELLPGVLYRGEKYLITGGENEISVYNLYTNNLIAKYVPAMSVRQSPITIEDGFCVFSLEKNVFEEDVRELTIRTITGGGFRPR
jgi:hypothetical protein